MSTEHKVDGPVYNAGRSEGHADIAARLRAILDPEDENHWNIDGVLAAVEDNKKMLDAEKILREKAEADYAFMVQKAADQHLGGYRELGARAASAENEADVLRSRLRKTAQILIEAVGADGPMDAEDAARRAVEVIEHHRECMKQAGLAAFMRGRTPLEVGDHLRMVLASYEVEIQRLHAKNARLSDLLDEGFTIVNDHLQHSYDLWLTKVIEEEENVDTP